jgi:hypothetical protein
VITGVQARGFTLGREETVRVYREL